jgi:urease accessory protein
MRRVTAIRRAGEWAASAAADRVVLDAGDRHRRRRVLEGEHGLAMLLDRPQPVLLRDGDGLVLDDGSIVAVVGAPEPLLELAARSPSGLVRLAWHIGNRHAEVQVAGERLRIRRDHVLEQMAAGLGATVAPVEAPFDPETATEHGRDGHDHG